eukprot:276654-Pyramimonas_sp.AAC.1
MLAVSTMFGQNSEATRSLIASFAKNEEKAELALRKVDQALNDPRARALVDGMDQVGSQTEKGMRAGQGVGP